MAIFEKYESRTEVISANGIKAQRIFLANWLTRHEDARNAGAVIGALYPDLNGCFCQSVRFIPTGGSTADGPTHAKVVADYSSLEATQQQTPGWYEESLDFGGEMLVKGGLAWESDDNPAGPDDPATYVWYPRAEYTRTLVIDDITGWTRKIYDATGKVNSSSFLSAAKETWLFEGASVSSFVTSQGDRNWRLTFRFIYRDIGWNTQHRKDDPEVGGKDDKLIDNEGKYIYETTSFRTLLSP